MRQALRDLRSRLQAFERPRAPERMPVRIGRRRIYVLPTAFGLFYGVLVLAMVLGALNYNNNPALMLALLLGASGLASLIAAHLQLSGLQAEALSAEPVAAAARAWCTTAPRSLPARCSSAERWWGAAPRSVPACDWTVR